MKLLLSIPSEFITTENNYIFKKGIIFTLRRAFELGQQNLSLAIAAINSLKRLHSRVENKIFNKYLAFIVPFLSNYLISDYFSISDQKARFNLSLDELKIKKEVFRK